MTKRTDDILRTWFEWSQVGPVLIGSERRHSVGELATYTHTIDGALPEPITVRIVREASPQEFLATRGRLPNYPFVYEIEGLD